jgi:hypothetical protein
MNPSTSAEWADYSALYDEFRVIGVRIRLVSTQQFSVTAANSMCVIVFDNDDTATLGSVDAGLQYNAHYLFPAVVAHAPATTENKDTCLDYTFMRPTGGKNTPIDWIDVASAAGSLGAVKYFSTNLTVSLKYFDAAVEWFVELRGRR